MNILLVPSLLNYKINIVAASLIAEAKGANRCTSLAKARSWN